MKIKVERSNVGDLVTMYAVDGMAGFVLVVEHPLGDGYITDEGGDRMGFGLSYLQGARRDFLRDCAYALRRNGWVTKEQVEDILERIDAAWRNLSCAC